LEYLGYLGFYHGYHIITWEIESVDGKGDDGVSPDGDHESVYGTG